MRNSVESSGSRTPCIRLWRVGISLFFIAALAACERTVKSNIPTDIQSVLIYRDGYEDFQVVDLSKPYREITDQKTVGAVYACLTESAASEKAYILWGDDLVILVRSASGKILHAATSRRGLKKSLLSPLHFAQDSRTVTLGSTVNPGRWIEVEGEWLSQWIKQSDLELLKSYDEKNTPILDEPIDDLLRRGKVEGGHPRGSR